ncbi:MAG: hypothetical protein A2V63_04420 [Candidatus Eisenbacteria bacterium RBG_19FT_COMBO_70_11]|nr:MAG: hypothetical protein A2V63_04420 [Candidatus Eisenbacteria bacterium RBG_19FT_COMBO_70_11]
MFVEEYLQELRRDRFAPHALLRYARRAAGRAREDWVSNPSAVRSVWNIALGFFAAAFAGAVAISLGYDRRLAYDFFLRTALWIPPAFGFVTLYLGLLRDRDGYRLSALNLPILLTLVRLVLAPGIALFVVDRHFALAFSAYLLASLTDVGDGWLARRWGQITPLGTALDPLVDIVFHLAILGGLHAAGLLPTWVFAVAALRYGMLLVGGACLHLFVGPVKIQPTAFGRFTGVMMSALVMLLMLLPVLRPGVAAKLEPLTVIALGVLFSATVVQVAVLGWYNLRLMQGEEQARGRVVGDVRWDGR